MPPGGENLTGMLSTFYQPDKLIPCQVSPPERSLLGQVGPLLSVYWAPAPVALLLFWNTNPCHLCSHLCREHSSPRSSWGSLGVNRDSAQRSLPQRQHSWPHPKGHPTSTLFLSSQHTTVRSCSMHLCVYMCAVCVPCENMNSTRARTLSFLCVSLACRIVLGMQLIVSKYLFNEWMISHWSLISKLSSALTISILFWSELSCIK